MRKPKGFYLKDFLKLGSAGGILLMIAAVLAIILANSPLAEVYTSFIDLPVSVKVGSFKIAKPLLLWINDGFMSLFFLLVGLELKREMLEGELSTPANIALPALGALGGMLVPAGIYVAFNFNDPVAISGWAIPTATDIAFALGILSLLGSRVPISLKIFLTSLAIFDDIGAVLIIAIFYTANISFSALAVVGICLLVLFYFNKRGFTEKMPYFAVGLIMWIALLKSGVHATLAGVLLALFIPIRDAEGASPLRELEHDLHTVIAFGILPLFAFANSGIVLLGVAPEAIFNSVSNGIIAGLFIGKQLGIFFFCWVGVKLNIARLPQQISWKTLYGTAVLCGIGFTMSLFIGSLAFTGPKLFDERIGIVFGSLLSGVLGYSILSFSLKKTPAATETTPQSH